MTRRFDASDTDDRGVATDLDRYVGARLRARRLFMQMSESWLADFLTIDVSELKAIEAGKRHLTADQLAGCAQVLDVAPRYFALAFDVGPRRSSWLREVDRWFAAQIFPHERELARLARRLTGSSESARDVVQEAYAEILSGDRWRALLNPRAYAFKVVRSTAARLLARKRVISIDFGADPEALFVADDGVGAEDLMSAKQKRQILLEAIEALPPQCRRVVKLRRLKETPPRDIARHLGISLSAVEKHLARGMVLIAAHLRDREDPGSTGNIRSSAEFGRHE